MFQVECKEDQTFLHTLLSMVMLSQNSPADLSDRILLTRMSKQTVLCHIYSSYKLKLTFVNQKRSSLEHEQFCSSLIHYFIFICLSLSLSLSLVLFCNLSSLSTVITSNTIYFLCLRDNLFKGKQKGKNVLLHHPDIMYSELSFILLLRFQQWLP